ncbi:MAG: hypothetical protein QF405_05240 [Roseibacillus sp.]|nr:hypothetical protein [Roseibacillus sp.]
MRVAGRLVDCVAATTGMPRGFAYATVMLTDESVLAVYSVHLKSNSGGIEETTPKREESARQLIAHCNGLKERFEKEGKAFYAVIGGDFNSDPTSEKWAEDDTQTELTSAAVTTCHFYNSPPFYVYRAGEAAPA